MSRAATPSISARSAAFGWGGVVILIGCASLLIGRPAASTHDVSTPPVAATSDVASSDRNEVLEFRLPHEFGRSQYLLVIGSLGDAADSFPIRLEPIPPGPADSPVRPPDRFGRAPLDNHLDNPTWSNPTSAPSLPRETPSEHLADGRGASSGENASRTPHRVFFLQLGQDPNLESSYRPLQTELVARSSRVRIWQEIAPNSGWTADDRNWLLRRLEDELLPGIADFFGNVADLDADGTLSICLTSRLTELPAADSPVEGLVQFNDFLPYLRRPFSNAADVMFLSADLRPGSHATAILAHELSHLAVFSRRREVDPEARHWDDDWLNEGLAHVAEVACGGAWSNLQPRIAAFAQHPASSPLLVTDAQRQGLWRHPGARGAAWSFLTWLAQTHGRHVLTNAALGPDIGAAKIERIVQRPFPELFRDWSLHVWTSPPTRPAGLKFASLPPRAAPVHPLPRLELTPTSSAVEFSLRGSCHQGCGIAASSSGPSGWRIVAPQAARLQATILTLDAESPRVWVVK